MEELEKRNAEMTGFTNALEADLKKMGLLMSTKDDLITKQATGIKQLRDDEQHP